jgi:two-component system, LytTR family, response regulator LytT
MKTYKVLLVDDEFLALNLMAQFIGELADLEIVGKCKSAIQALEVLQQQHVDILFLDIQMPVLSGTKMLKTLHHAPATIFTTAYSEHAVEAFDLNAVDYLLKPFAFERFLQAVNKAKEFLNRHYPFREGGTDPSVSNLILNQNEETEGKIAEQPIKEFLAMKVDGKIEKIIIADILYIEGLKEYVKIVCSTRYYVAYESMKNLEDSLPSVDFLRVHKSYIVAKRRVQALDGNQLDIGKVKIPISRERKEEIVKAIFQM